MQALQVQNNNWDIIKDNLRHKYGDNLFQNWFCKIELETESDTRVILSAPTNFIRDWIKVNYLDVILKFWKMYNPSIYEIDIIAYAKDRLHDDKLQDANKRYYVQSNTSNTSTLSSSISNSYNSITNNDFTADSTEFYGSVIDPRFTFDNFVVGSSNQLAYAAAIAVAESKDALKESNPLFLYGGVGLGKTHLMHSIAWHINEHFSNRKVIYMSAEKFMYQFIKALRNKDIMSFKERFRSVDVLMIDDIQFICGKDNTQEEFFHTFNALVDNNKQMVISCDRSPSDLDNIEERIKSRLGWGLVADVHSTNYELRIGILHSKVEQMNVKVSDDVIEFLASKITSNVRELEGALNKVIAHSNLIGIKITIEATQNILKDLLRANERLVTIDEIQRKVADRYNIKISDIISVKRVRVVARPRQVAMYLAKNLTSKSLTEIGNKFGKRDHTTVIHASKTIENLILKDPELQEEVRLLTKILQY